MDSFLYSGNSSLFQIELIILRISERIVLPSALINSAGICSIPGDLCLWISYSFNLCRPQFTVHTSFIQLKLRWWNYFFLTLRSKIFGLTSLILQALTHLFIFSRTQVKWVKILYPSIGQVSSYRPTFGRHTAGVSLAPFSVTNTPFCN